MGPHTQQQLSHGQMVRWLVDTANVPVEHLAALWDVDEKSVYNWREKDTKPRKSSQQKIETTYEAEQARYYGRPNPIDDLKTRIKGAIDQLTDQQLHALQQDGTLAKILGPASENMRAEADAMAAAANGGAGTLDLPHAPVRR